MSDARKIVIVGCGPAAVGAAMAARNQDKTAEVLMLSDEDCEPYEKPPLSKAVLTGKAMPQDAPIAGPAGIAGKGITLRLNARVKEIDRGAKAVTTETGERIPYDALILATGSINRVLPMFPAGQKGIHYLRTQAEALALKARANSQQVADRDRRRRRRAGDRLLGSGTRRQDHRDGDRAAHPARGSVTRNLRDNHERHRRAWRRYPARHRATGLQALPDGGSRSTPRTANTVSCRSPS